jgi:hypothetical protein
MSISGQKMKDRRWQAAWKKKAERLQEPNPARHRTGG